MNEIAKKIVEPFDGLLKDSEVLTEILKAVTKRIIYELEQVEEQTRTKCAILVYECKNHLDHSGKPGFISADECKDLILSSRDLDIVDYV